VCRFVWSRNLEKEEALDRVGPQRHKEEAMDRVGPQRHKEEAMDRVGPQRHKEEAMDRVGPQRHKGKKCYITCDTIVTDKLYEKGILVKYSLDRV